MATEVDICNLALSHLGQGRTITAISPPDGSTEAALCAKYYPQARDVLLESYIWNFATRRVTLAEAGTPPDHWAYSYAMPANVVRVLSVHELGSTQPMDYALEHDGTAVRVYTNVPSAEMKFTYALFGALGTPDPALGGPTFAYAMSLLLASMLAGPIIKGKPGADRAAALRQEAMAWAGKAQQYDANEQKEQIGAQPGYTSARIRPASVRARS